MRHGQTSFAPAHASRSNLPLSDTRVVGPPEKARVLQRSVQTISWPGMTFPMAPTTLKKLNGRETSGTAGRHAAIAIASRRVSGRLARTWPMIGDAAVLARIVRLHWAFPIIFRVSDWPCRWIATASKRCGFRREASATILLARFWTNIFDVSLPMACCGLVMSYSSGPNCEPILAHSAKPGPMIGYEVGMGFLLEATFSASCCRWQSGAAR